MKPPHTISSSDLKSHTGRMLRAVGRGRSLTITHRSKPLARLVPLLPEVAVPANDPIFRLAELAEPMGSLTNEQIDRLVYGA